MWGTMPPTHRAVFPDLFNPGWRHNNMFLFFLFTFFSINEGRAVVIQPPSGIDYAKLKRALQCKIGNIKIRKSYFS